MLDDSAGEADQPQHATLREITPLIDHSRALPRGARRAEKRKGDQHEGERIDRREHAVMQLGAELARLLDRKPVVGFGRDQLPQVALAHRVFERSGEFANCDRSKA